MTDYRYMIHGGMNYSFPRWEDDSEWFDALEAALAEWARRRCDWSGRFPLWGDMSDGADEYCILLGNEAETVEAWSVRSALAELGRDADELAHYFDEANL